MNSLDNTIASCDRYLNMDDNKGSELESILTQFLLIKICGDYEKIITDTISLKLQKITDCEVINFIHKTIEKPRILTTDQLINILKKFNIDKGNKFKNVINKLDQTISYQNMIINRDSVAHGNSYQASYDDVKQWHGESKIILDKFSEALNNCKLVA